jgi:Putative beta barrel porin-7 (BBP7)
MRLVLLATVATSSLALAQSPAQTLGNTQFASGPAVAPRFVASPPPATLGPVTTLPPTPVIPVPGPSFGPISGQSPPPYPGELPPIPPGGFNVGTPLSPQPQQQPFGPGGFVEQRPPSLAAERLYTSFEYLLWFAKGDTTPSLAATSGAPVNPNDLNRLNDSAINEGVQSGFRATFGFWFDYNRTFGIEGRYQWFVMNDDRSLFNSSPGSILGRPFTDADRARASFLSLSNLSGSINGAIEERTHFDSDGAEINVLWRGPALVGENFHWIAGYRYFYVEEGLRIESVSAGGNPATRIGAYDSFATLNRFHGAQFGARWQIAGERWGADLTAKLALGAVSQTSVIGGATAVITANTAPTLRNGGLLALESNSGRYTRSKIAFLPEVALNVTYKITSHVHAFVGYDFLYLSNVVRAGSQVDTAVSPSQFPLGGPAASGTPKPQYTPEGEGFWMQGINFGIAFRY